MKKILKTSFLLAVVLMLLCGVVYPLLITGIGQLAFNNKANGSVVTFNGKTVGSKLIGQSFSDPRFFVGRISSNNYNTYTEADTKPDKNGKVKYSGVTSGGSNLAPSNKALTDRVKKDMDDFLKSHPTLKMGDIPTDLLTASASGLDPEISPQSAKVQIDAVSKASGISKTDLEGIVNKYTSGRTFGIFGEPRVNVLMVNLEIAEKLKGEGKL
jgi:K+-transporting ATPase ATPase C chain